MFKNLFSTKTAQTEVAAKPVLMDEELGLPFGEPGTPERAAWIAADNARWNTDTDELKSRLAQYTA